MKLSIGLMIPTVIGIAVTPIISENVNDITASCDRNAGEDIRLFGSGADAGRVEICWESKWRYICMGDENSLTRGQSLDWPREIATVACRHLGYARPFLAKRAADMAMGESIDSGISPDLAGISIAGCNGTETSLYQCQLKEDKTCNIYRSLGAACATAPAATLIDNAKYTSKKQETSKIVDDLAAWFSQEKLTIAKIAAEASKMLENSCDVLSMETRMEKWNIATPFHDVDSIRKTFLFHDDVAKSYGDIKTIFEQQDALFLPHHSNETSLLQLIQKSTHFVKFNAYGLDLSPFFESLGDKSLSAITSTIHRSPELNALRLAYLSSNQHNALHWYLDNPYRYYEPTIEDFNGDVVAHDLFKKLQKDGFVEIDDFGGDIEGIWKIVEPTLTVENSIRHRNETSISGAGSIITSRVPILPLEDILLRNSTITSVVEAYLGPSVLHGYKTTYITKSLSKVDQYNAALYHHDRVGRRLKAFVFLHDVDCERGHPTKVAAGTQNILFYKTENYPSTRFNDEFVDSNYEIKKGCGKKGGGFLFDTHTIHKGSLQGDQERTVIIAEYHNIARCDYSHKYNLGLPCPAGDIYRMDSFLS